MPRNPSWETAYIVSSNVTWENGQDGVCQQTGGAAAAKRRDPTASRGEEAVRGVARDPAGRGERNDIGPRHIAIRRVGGGRLSLATVACARYERWQRARGYAA